MATSTTVATIGSTFCREFIAHKVSSTSATMATAAKNSDVVNKIISFRHYFRATRILLEYKGTRLYG
jgi:hypothetical protein